MARPEVKREYVHWLALDKATKVGLGLPTEHKGFAQDKGVSPRTLRRWRDDDEFQQLVEQRKVELAKAGPNSTVSAEQVGPPRPHKDSRSAGRRQPPRPATAADHPDYDPDLPPDELHYLKVKRTLTKMAAEGNQGAMDLYFKHWGRTFIEAEQADGDLFSDMSDEDLLAEIVRLAGEDRVAHVLADLAVDGA